MPSTLDLCEKYFGTRDVYKILEITKDSLEKDIKKAYYKLSLKVHPDRVPSSEKDAATEKFKILTKLHVTLSDKNKKALYDEQGIFDDEDDDGKVASWLEVIKNMFKPISVQDIDNFKNDYIDSELERTDIKKAYLGGKGCINHMMETVPFMSVEDEPRIQNIVKEMIASGEVPEYKLFTKEPKDKRDRRHKKYAREAKEAKKIQSKLEKENGGDSLEMQIAKRQQEREANYSSMLDKLMEKYGNDEDDESVNINKLSKKIKPKVGKTVKKTEAKSKDRKTKAGKVTKKR